MLNEVPTKTLSCLIYEFELLTKRQIEQIMLDDIKEIREIDARIGEAFAELLKYDPKSTTESRDKLMFLLDFLCPIEHRSEAEAQICEKIADISCSLHSLYT